MNNKSAVRTQIVVNDFFRKLYFFVYVINGIILDRPLRLKLR